MRALSSSATLRVMLRLAIEQPGPAVGSKDRAGACSAKEAPLAVRFEEIGLALRTSCSVWRHVGGVLHP